MHAVTNPATLYLVDGSSYLYRAFHAMPNLSNAAGEPTGAIYGVANMLRRLLQAYQPQQLAVVFDAKGPTFRHTLYPAYKANRPPMPTELATQITTLHQLVQALGLPLLMESGVEADDVIATLTRQATAAGMGVRIFSGDKDLAQLVEPQVWLIDTMKDTCLDPQGVTDKYGVPPNRIIDYLTLMGDSSDNVPGVLGVGPKTAVKWLNSYGSLAEVIAHAADISGKVGDNLRAALPLLPLSQQLVTVRDDVPLSVTPATLRRTPPDQATLNALYQRLGFKSWLTEIARSLSGAKGNGAANPLPSTTLRERSGAANPFPPFPSAPLRASDYAQGEERSRRENTNPPNHYALILEQADFDAWLQRLWAAPLFAFDTETTGLDYMQADLVGVSFAITPSEATYVPLAHDYLGAPAQLSRDAVLAALKPLLEDPKQAKVGQHLKYDAHILRRYGIELRGIAHDTMLESYVLDSTATRHNLDALALHYLQYQTIHYEDIAGKGVKQLTFNQITLEQAAPYAAEDADVCLRLHQQLWPLLQTQPRLQQIYQDLEIPLIPVLGRMEHGGVCVDVALLAQHSQTLDKRLRELEQAAWEMAGQPFNLGSPKQLQEILFDKLQLPVLEKTPKGQPSTAESVLQELALDYPLPHLLMEHRSLSKLKSTYTDKLPGQIDPTTKRLHTSYHQAVTATGRLSSADPNLQNIPIRTEEGRRIRQAFIAPPGHVLLAADYSQIELRIMAHLSQDPGLLAAFAAGLDVHRATAAEIFAVPPEQIDKTQRRAAKAINFGLIYGMSPFGLAKQLGVSRTIAQDYVTRYFERYSGVKNYMDHTRAQASAQGYIETLFGRRLYLPDINARNGQRRQAAERTAINAPMQGTAADIIKRAMLNIDAWIESSGVPLRMVMQVHDELVFEVRQDAVETLQAEICARMSAAAQLDVPLLVEAGWGANWDEAH